MPTAANRRLFLQTTAAAGIGFWAAGGLMPKRASRRMSASPWPASVLGVKGLSDSTDAGKHGDVVAICDVDASCLAAIAKRFPKAKQFTDYRKLLEEMGKSIDAVTVSTPDHHHAPAALMAMRLGKHCFCQKPLTKSIYEARLMADVARQMKVATQMGNQGTSYDALRKSVAVIKSGAIGAVKEVHVWTNRPIWPQGNPRAAAAATPAKLDWNLLARPRDDTAVCRRLSSRLLAPGGTLAPAPWATWRVTP